MKKRERGLFDEEYKLAKISKRGDPLEELDRRIDFEQFRPVLNKAFNKKQRGVGGARPYDYVMMFKILILQRYYNISDGQTEYQINDRLSFMRFLGLTLGDHVPDEKTIWLFRDTLTKSGVIAKIFDQFTDILAQKGLIVNAGTIVDASFVEVPRQRNSREENETIKNGEIPSDWKIKPPKLQQKDTDARWTKKDEKTFFGYKDHVKIDKGSKLIETFTVTNASVHDSQEIEKLITDSDEHHELYGDSAYAGDPIKQILNGKFIQNRIHEKGHRGKPLTDEQRKRNRKKSIVRARVEHVFGFMENSMHGMYIRCVGIVRATGIIGLMNLTYNIFRSIHLVKQKKRFAYERL
jgi:IS5 family transposase